MTEVQKNGAESNGAAAAAAKAATVISFLKPQLVIEAPKASDAVAFYKAAFGAEEVNRVMHPKRKADQELPLVLSADLKLGSSIFSVSDLDTPLAKTVDGASATAGFVLVLESEDVEVAASKAVSAGAVAEDQVSEVEGAGRVAKLKDPYGYSWLISTPAKTTQAPPATTAAEVEATAA